MISKSAVSDKIRKEDLRVGKDFLDALDRITEFLVDEAIKRARWNKRKTVRIADLAYPMTDSLDEDQTENVSMVSTENKPLAVEKTQKEVLIGRTSGIFRIGGDRASR